MFPLRSKVTTVGRQASGARALWRATGTQEHEFGKPIVAIANSYTQFVPGHVHLKNVGDIVADAVRAAGGVPKEFNTIAVDDGIAMGHQGMLYSCLHVKSSLIPSSTWSMPTPRTHWCVSPTVTR